MSDAARRRVSGQPVRGASDGALPRAWDAAENG